ncbi:MAG: hypothetical protein DRJ02_05780 [Bacteroidetes bacterium]|nr:MAG: hypothetical protein DRJ02_05780 [Bacteroidota bacterium]
MNYFTNSLITIRFISKAFATNREKGTYHLYVQKTAAEEIKKSHELNDGSIIRIHYLKIQWYMATTLYLGELLSELRPEKLTQDEKRSLIYMGALIAITDLMVDELQLPYKKIKQLMTDEAERQRNDLTAIERILLLYYRKLLTIINNDQKKDIHDFSLLKPQIDSQAQLSGTMTEDEVVTQTHEKGGTALLLVASLLFEMDEKNRTAFYQLGAFIQLMNDSQDLPKDLRNGVTTFVSFQNSYDDIRQVLEKEFEKTVIIFSANDFPEKGVYRLLFYLHALLTGIEYKLLCYGKITDGVVDADRIIRTDKSDFRVSAFSLNSIIYCFPKILKFDNNYL